MENKTSFNNVKFQGVCRCCFSSTACKSLVLPVSNKIKETYAEMLEKSLGLNIQSSEDPSEVKLEPHLYLICDDCIRKLENCVEFKQLIMTTLDIFCNIKKEQLIHRDGTIDGGNDFDSRSSLSPMNTYEESDEKKLIDESKSPRSIKLEDFNRCHNDVDNLTDLELDKGLNELIKTENIKTKKKYIKKKPSGAQRAREILQMMDQEMLQCKICSQIFHNNYSLKVHMHEHFPDYKCDICGKGFAIKKQCQYHRRRHQIGEFVCSHCGKMLTSRAKYDHHMFSHRTKHSYICRYCNERFKSHYAREKHLRDEHKSEKKYKCDKCTEMFLVKGTLDIHYRRIHEKRENKYVCDMCSRGFFDRTALKKHMIVHNGKRIHECVVCHKSYPRIRTLQEHMKIHNNVRDHMCNMCGKVFVQACTLRGHLKVHEKEKMREFTNTTMAAQTINELNI